MSGKFVRRAAVVVGVIGLATGVSSLFAGLAFAQDNPIACAVGPIHTATQFLECEGPSPDSLLGGD